MPLFPELPKDISAASDDDLQKIVDDSLAIIDGLAEGDPELVGELNDDEVLAEGEKGLAGIKAAKAEQTRRTEAATDVAQKLADLKAAAHEGTEEPAVEEEPVAEEDPAEEPAAEEVAAVEEPEPVAAAAPPTRTIRRAPARTAEHEPRVVITERGHAPEGAITAAAEGIGYPMGASMPNIREVARAIEKKVAAFGNHQQSGTYENVTIAQFHTRFGEERQLESGRDQDNYRKLMDVVGDDAMGVDFNGKPALVASGGLCAPVTPYYDLQLVSETMRPVRDALPSFQATRGGIRFMVPPALSSITTAIGRITAAADAAGGTNATKSCQTIACPSQVEVDVAIIYHCLRFGNLGTRAWPEQIEQATGLTMAAWSRLAETALLDGIGAASTAVTAAGIAGGANSNLLAQIVEAAAAQRNRHRMDPRRVLRVLLPAWSVDMLVVDLIRSQFERFDMSFDGMVAYLRTLNIAPSFYVDGATGAGQVFGAQGASALLAFPTTVVWYLFPEGSFVYLDGGTLDLGVVRDSTLNNTNDYTIFGEGFENVAFIGIESLKVTSTLCASGAVTAPVSVTCPIAA